MSHLLDELLAQAANGSPVTAAFSSEDVAVLLFASEFLGVRENWLDKGVDPLDEVSDADWDEIEKLVGNVYEALMTPLVGQVVPILMGTIPENMLLCDGTQYLRVDYPSLYAILDSVFIDDADHFTLPDLRGRVVVGSGNGPGLSPYSVGATGGEERHALSQIEGPSHAHVINDPGHSHGPASPSIVFRGAHAGGASGYATTNVGQVVDQITATGSAMTGLSMEDSGSNVPHNNIQPYLSLNWAVVAF